MSRILQPQSRFEVQISKTDGSKALTITDYVGDSVSLEMDINMLSTLNFSLRLPEDVDWISVGNKITFYGGYIENNKYYSSDSNRFQSTQRFKRLFVGNVIRLGINMENDGNYLVTVTAVDTTWSKSGYKNNFYRYPSRNCLRNFAKDKDTLTLEEIVTGICGEINVGKPRISLSDKTNTTFTLKDPIVQENQSDWEFLLKLARLNACYVWTSVEENDVYVNFTDKSVAMDSQGRLEFVWVARTGRNFNDADYYNKNATTAAQDKGYEGLRGGTSKLKDNQVLLNTISVEISPSVQGLNITKITDFNQTTGQFEEKFVSYDETKDEIIFWDLNEAKVKQMNSTPEGAAELSRIQQMGPFGIDRETFINFYTPVTMPKGILNAIDRPFLGVNVSATCEGNVNIIPQQSYPVHGIPRVTTSGIKTNTIRFFLKSLTHNWDSNGFTTNLEFMA